MEAVEERRQRVRRDRRLARLDHRFARHARYKLHLITEPRQLLLVDAELRLVLGLVAMLVDKPVG